MAQCSCDVLLGNAGSPGCVASHGVAKKLIRVPLIANDGTENKIDLSVALDQAAITALINQADASKRWYPTPLFKTVTQERADNITEDFDDGSSAFVRNGVKTFTGFITKGASPQLVGVLEDDRCTDFGVYIVDDCGNLIGRDISDGFLYPIPVDNGSYAPTYVEPTDTTVAKVNLAFNFSTLFQDSNLGFIEASAIGATLLSENGLLDVVFSNASASTDTAASVELAYIYGPSNAKLPVTGLLPAEIVIYNVTDDAAVVTATAPETPDGTYSLTFLTQGSGKDLKISVSKDGIDPDDSVTVTTP
jgi:hypothetical protein